MFLVYRCIFLSETFLYIDENPGDEGPETLCSIPSCSYAKQLRCNVRNIMHPYSNGALSLPRARDLTIEKLR